MVVVNGYDAINEALTVAGKGWDFANRREPYYAVQLYNPKKLGTLYLRLYATYALTHSFFNPASTNKTQGPTFVMVWQLYS